MIRLYTDTHRLPIGKSGFAKVLRRSLDRLAQALIRHELRKFGLFEQSAGSSSQWGGLVSPRASKFLSKELRASIRSYSERHYAYLETADYSVVHRFADRLDEMAREMGPESGFVTKGSSVFRLMEPRWNDFLLTSNMAYIDMIRDDLAAHPQASMTTLTNHSFVERAALQIARQQRRQAVSRDFSVFSFILALLQKTDRNAKRKQAYRNIMRDWRRAADGAMQNAPGAPKTRPRVLFVGYKDRTLRRLEAAVPRLINNFNFDVWVLGNQRRCDKAADATADRIAASGARAIWASAFLTRAEVETIASRAQKAVRRSWAAFFDGIPRLEYHGIDLTEEALPLIKAVARDASAPAAVCAEASARALDHAQPDLVVNFEEWELNRSISLEARRRGIPTASYQTFSPVAHVGLLRRLTDACAMPGSFLLRSYQGYYAPENMEIVGDTLVDAIVKLDRSAERKALCDQRQLDPKKPILMIFTTYADDLIGPVELEAIYRVMVKAARGIGGQLVIKAHPQQPLVDVKDILRRVAAPSSTIVIHNADLLRLAAGVDIALMTATSAASQVIMAGTPLISLQPFAAQEQLEKLYGYRHDAGIPVLDPSEDLQALLKELLEDEKRRRILVERGREYVVRHVGPLDGQASDRLGRFLASRIKGAAANLNS